MEITIKTNGQIITDICDNLDDILRLNRPMPFGEDYEITEDDLREEHHNVMDKIVKVNGSDEELYLDVYYKYDDYKEEYNSNIYICNDSNHLLYKFEEFEFDYEETL